MGSIQMLPPMRAMKSGLFKLGDSRNVGTRETQ